jgi:hypothetical protein
MTGTRDHINPTEKRLYIVEPTLFDELGHMYDYCRQCIDAASPEGWACTLVAPSNAREVARNLGCEAVLVLPPILEGAPTSRPAKLGLSARMPRPLGLVMRWISKAFLEKTAIEKAAVGRAKQLGASFSDWLATVSFNKGDCVFCPTLHWAEASVLAEAVAKLNGPRPKLVLMLRDVTPESHFGRRAMRRAAKLTASSTSWVSDTEELASAYQKVLHQPVTKVRIPVDIVAINQERKSERPKEITILFLGEARLEKGIHYLPKLISDYQRQNSQHPVRFIVQIAHSFRGDTPELVNPTLEALDNLRGPNVFLEPRPLSTQKFHAYVANADILIALYDPKAYRWRSSGTIVAALASGLVVLAMRGTSWIESILNRPLHLNQAVLCNPEADDILRGLQEATEKAQRIRGQGISRASLPDSEASAPWSWDV